MATTTAIVHGHLIAELRLEKLKKSAVTIWCSSVVSKMYKLCFQMSEKKIDAASLDGRNDSSGGFG